MNAVRVLALVSLLCFELRIATSAEFVNLGFDQANTDNPQPDRSDPHGELLQGTMEDLLPGWTAFYDQQIYRGIVYYPYQIVNSPNLGKFGPNVPYAHEGYFSFVPDIIKNSTHKFSLQQTGVVPLDAWYLRTYGGGIYLNGVKRSFELVPGFNQAQFDVHNFAGQEVLLEIRNYDKAGRAGGVEIDILGFATPEPSVSMLLMFGGGSLLLLALRRRSSRRVTKLNCKGEV